MMLIKNGNLIANIEPAIFEQKQRKGRMKGWVKVDSFVAQPEKTIDIPLLKVSEIQNMKLKDVEFYLNKYKVPYDKNRSLKCKRDFLIEFVNQK